MPTIRSSPHSLSRPVEPARRLLCTRMSPPVARQPIGVTPKAPRAGSLSSIGRAPAHAVMSFVPPRSLTMAPAPLVRLAYRPPPTPTVAAPIAPTAPPSAPTPETLSRRHERVSRACCSVGSS